MKYLITGGCGFLGSNIASALIAKKCDVTIYDNLSRKGSDLNLKWLQEQGSFQFVHADTTDPEKIQQTIKELKPDVVYHLAGQVAMTTSMADPVADFKTNALASVYILEALRHYSPGTVIIYSSTNKVYGDLEYLTYTQTPTRYICQQYPLGFDENTKLDFHSPYGCSKGSADQYMLDYARLFNIKSIVFRHSSMYGSRQFGSFDQGWISWFIQKALESTKSKTDFTISGNGKQVRDVLYADDMVDLYLRAPQYADTAKGHAFNIGGGMENSLSLLELFGILEQKLHTSLQYTRLPPRESDQKIFVADLAKAKAVFNWSPKIDKITGIEKTISWLEKTIF